MFHFQTAYFIISCPHLAKFDLIPGLYLKGSRRHLRYRAAVTLLNRNTFDLFVQNCSITGFFTSSVLPLVNSICPLLVEEWHSQFEVVWQMKNVHTAEWGSLMEQECVSACGSRTKCSFRRCFFLEMISESWSLETFDRRAEENVTHYWIHMQIHGPIFVDIKYLNLRKVKRGQKQYKQKYFIFKKGEGKSIAAARIRVRKKIQQDRVCSSWTLVNKYCKMTKTNWKEKNISSAHVQMPYDYVLVMTTQKSFLTWNSAI